MKKKYENPTLDVRQTRVQTMLTTISSSFGDDDGHYDGSDDEEAMSTIIWTEEL